MNTATMKMPASWASYLVNGDASGLEPGERKLADAHLKRNSVTDVLGCNDDPHFTWSFELYGGDFEGGEVLTYTVVLAPSAPDADRLVAEHREDEDRRFEQDEPATGCRSSLHIPSQQVVEAARSVPASSFEHRF